METCAYLWCFQTVWKRGVKEVLFPALYSHSRECSYSGDRGSATGIVVCDMSSGVGRILDDNPIKIIPSQMFMGLKSLFFMSMVNNSLEQLPGSGLCTDTPALNWLFLRQNEISVISENTFSSLRNLIELDLSGNKLHRLPANIFQDLRSLETLNLSGNNLSHIHPSQFDSLACVRSL
ncbi:UNVERIFIED_CONTAM: hypothetical protein FKN15_076419 [Acipenser sinensis]